MRPGHTDFAGAENTALLLVGFGLGFAWNWWATVALGVGLFALTLREYLSL
jgi:hypothetical protein